MKKKDMKDILNYLENNQRLGDVSEIHRGVLKEEDRPFGECWACERFGAGALIHEHPGTAKCCIGCDAYKGKAT